MKHYVFYVKDSARKQVQIQSILISLGDKQNRFELTVLQSR
jgi:hypothetical protein